MHDPMVVAFEIRRPWPRRDSWVPKHSPRWSITMRSPFWMLAGRRYYFPSLVTVWHVEPRGHDSGEVCKHYRRWQDNDGKWHMKILHGWRFHAHHMHVQVIPAQKLRRWALTRCAWCGGRSRKGDEVNVSHQWDGPRGRWWRGEPGLFHHDCSTVEHSHRMCLCESPVLEHDGWGRCARCRRFRSYGSVPDEADHLLAALPPGSRIPADLKPRLEALWAQRRARKEATR